MSRIAQLFSALVILAGGAVLITFPFQWQWTNLASYACYFALTLLLSRVTVNIPSVAGSLSIFSVFVLFSIVSFSLPQTLLLGCAASLIHSLAQQSGRINVRYVVFNVCNLALAIVISARACHSHLLHDGRLETALLVALTSALFFGLYTFSIASVIALSENTSLLAIWRAESIWCCSYYLLGSLLAGTMVLVEHTIGWQTGLLVVPGFVLLYRLYENHLARADDGKRHAEEMAALHLRTIEALALAIEAKDQAAHDHLRRVQVYAMELAKDLGLNDGETEALRAASVLHDIGKLAVPEHIISKPGKLTREEFDKMKIHPIVGAEILERVRFPYPVTPIVRAHHEKWNGSGYPDGLKGEEIPIGARILAAVDCLDALTSDRQYRRAMSLEEAMRKVASESGVSFDPQVIEVLSRRCADLEKLVIPLREEPALLSTQIKIARGLEPGNGLAVSDSPDTAPKASTGFLNSIAAARQEVQILFELAQDLGNSLSVNETLSLVGLRLKRIIPYDSLVIFVPEGDMLRPEYVTGESFRLLSSLQIPFGQGLSGWVAENRLPVVNGDPAMEPGYFVEPSWSLQMSSALAVPLVGVTGLTGVLTLYCAEREAFTQDHLRILLAVAPKLALAIDNALKFQKAEVSAATDYMTGLPNARSLFLHLEGELARVRRSAAPLVVLVSDLNGFKQVNDRFGHLEGNRLLREVANKLKESCREYDYVARMGGDEFVLVLPGLSLDQLQAKTTRLDAITREAGNTICGVDTLGLSIGHAAYPQDGSDAEQLLSTADGRMYQVKQKHKMRTIEPHGFDFDSLLAR